MRADRHGFLPAGDDPRLQAENTSAGRSRLPDHSHIRDKSEMIDLLLDEVLAEPAGADPGPREAGSGRPCAG